MAQKSYQETNYSFSIRDEQSNVGMDYGSFLNEFKSSPVGKTQYLALTNEDMLYFGNMNRLKNQEFQKVIRKITKDLNMLLHFKYYDFWAEIESSCSLRRCLSSCLQIFPRKNFGIYLKKDGNKISDTQFNIKQVENNSIFFMFGKLMQIVLFLYHRLICDSKDNEKDIVYDLWILDIPKILNLISIYKHSNLKILKQILDSTFKQIPQYINDIQDFIEFTSVNLLDALQLDLKFDFTQKIIRQSTNFDNPLLSFTRNLIKSFFRIFDVYSILHDFIIFFPEACVIDLFAKQNLFLDLIQNYFFYIENIKGRWQMSTSFKIEFDPVIEAVKKKIIEFILAAFDKIDKIIQRESQQQSSVKCLRNYSKICHELRTADNRSEWEDLFKILIQQTPHRQFFKINKYIQSKMSKQQIRTLKECQKFEKQLKNKSKQIQFDPFEMLQLKLNNIKSFRDWKDFENLDELNFQSFSENEPNGYSSLYPQDSILLELAKQTKKTKQKKEMVVSLFKNQQYDDEPLFQSKQQQTNNQLFFILQPGECYQKDDDYVWSDYVMVENNEFMDDEQFLGHRYKNKNKYGRRNNLSFQQRYEERNETKYEDNDLSSLSFMVDKSINQPKSIIPDIQKEDINDSNRNNNSIHNSHNYGHSNNQYSKNASHTNDHNHGHQNGHSHNQYNKNVAHSSHNKGLSHGHNNGYIKSSNKSSKNNNNQKSKNNSSIHSKKGDNKISNNFLGNSKHESFTISSIEQQQQKQEQQDDEDDDFSNMINQYGKKEVNAKNIIQSKSGKSNNSKSNQILNQAYKRVDNSLSLSIISESSIIQTQKPQNQHNNQSQSSHNNQTKRNIKNGYQR